MPLNEWCDGSLGLGYLIAARGVADCMMIVHPNREMALEVHEILKQCRRFKVRARYGEEETAELFMEAQSDPIPMMARRANITLCAMATYRGHWRIAAAGVQMFMKGIRRCGGFFVLIYAKGEKVPVAMPIFASLRRGG